MLFTRLRSSCKLVIYATRKTFCTNIEKSNTRVRFAPSPTGYMHLGGLRTAFYNYLFARGNNGKFILRIEDTDQKRIVEGAAKQLEYDLEWAGIPPDESPLKEGPFGPYMQSQRTHLYKEPIQQLLDSGAAYRCFCSEEHLALRRREILKMQGIPRYDNRCREISCARSDQRAAAGESFTVRFKLLEGPLSFDDMVFGPITIDLSTREGDFVIVKSDGIPTYHLANVIDDHLMQISHVLRGLEWQISTPKHIQIYRALNWKPPQYAHLPLLVNSDGSKLSKRQADLHCGNFRSDGVLPEVLLTFVTDIGGGFKRDRDKVKLSVQPLSDLIEQFDLTLIGTNPGKIDMTRLDKLNHSELSKHLANAESRKQLAVYTQQLLRSHFQERLSEDSEQFTLKYIDNVLRLAAPRLSRLGSLLIPEHEFIWFSPDEMTLSRLFPDTRKVYGVLKGSIPVLKEILPNPAEEARADIIEKLKHFCEATNRHYPLVMATIRVSVTGSKNSPSVLETLDLIGPDEFMRRLRFAFEVFGGNLNELEEEVKSDA